MQVGVGGRSDGRGKATNSRAGVEGSDGWENEGDQIVRCMGVAGGGSQGFVGGVVENYVAGGGDCVHITSGCGN